MKQNVIKTESNWLFQNNVKKCLQNKKLYDVPFRRHGHFYPILILSVKMIELPQQYAYPTVHWL